MRLMTKKFRSYLLLFNENPFIGGMTTWTGVKIGWISFKWENTQQLSGYSFKKLVNHARIGMISFSSKIIRVSSLFGFFVSIGSFIYLVYLGIRFILSDKQVPGFYTITGLLSLFFGIQSIFLGIIGEYLSETFETARKRPKYLVKQAINLNIKYQNQL
jgi:glycosyltransferase involved in cell wall biosynthesis